MKRIKFFQIGIMLMIVAALMGCSLTSTSTRRRSSSSAEETTADRSEKAVGIITMIDTDSKNLRFVMADNYEEVLCAYNNGISIFSKSGEAMSMAQLDEGDVCDIYYNTQTRIISKIQISKDKNVWENRGVSNFKIDDTRHEITIGQTLYTYDDKTVILSNGKSISIYELNRMDSLTVRGYGHEVISIVVETGHGYVSLTGATLFYGGLIDIGGIVVKNIEENMVITVTEGTYKVEAVNGDYSTTKTVTVERDELTKLSFADVKPNVTETGNVKFDIDVSGAKLYVDNVLKDDSQILTLTTGKHSVVVTASGYDDYSKTYTIVSGYQEFTISLAGNEETSETTTAETETTTVTGETVVSTINNVSVEGPEGAAIYFDSSYKGIAPVTFAMITGTHTITVINGTDIATYTVNLVEGANDVIFDFSQY